MSTQPEQQLAAYLSDVRRRWMTAAALRTAARALGWAALPLLAAAIADRVLRLHGAPLVGLVVVASALAFAAGAWALRLWPRRPADRQVARFIEERAAELPAGSLHDELVSAVAATESAPRTAFLPLIIEAALRRARDLEPGDVVSAAEMRRSGAEAAAASILLVAAAALAAPGAGRAFDTVRHWWAGGGARPVAATASAKPPSPPQVTRIDLHYTYPAFVRLAPRDEQDGGDVYAPAGTRVRFTVHVDKPLVRGELALGSARVLPLKATDDCTAEAELVLAKDDSYRIRLEDTQGLKSAGEAEYFIRLMDDRPPDVRILRPSADQPITPLEEVPIEARADDDYGIRSFDLVYAVAGRPEHVVAFDRVTGTNEQKIGSHLLAAEDLRVKPGDVITYYARARDVARAKPSTLVASDIYFLEVKPFNEEFVAAQSQAGSSGGDPQIASLIEAQKQIITSTWNVERRSAGGRSAEDIKAIAEAQAELKARAERQLASRSRRGRARPPAPPFDVAQDGGAPLAGPQQMAPSAPAGRPSGEEPMALAVDAMGKALQQLAADRTKDALTHQMAALNGLLQAQAEVRRRQVAQQSAGAGGGGGNRSEQDLSALFDKELQRDQKTNYENRPSVETRDEKEEKKASALDRIRDLARRQEELNQRQRELAESRASAEERKRQLERLTREQEELRRELEQLSQRSGRAGSSDPANEMREAGRQMRSAASELGRNDPNRASESGQRAADQLKQLERQMASGGDAQGRGGRPGAGRSAEAEKLSQQLEQTRAIRERLQRAEQQLRAAEERAQSGARQGAGRGQTPGQDGDVRRLREAYQRELQKAQDALARLGEGQSRSGDRGATPEEQQFSRSAPGTEAFKQDRSDWHSLRQNVDQALEKYEAAVSGRLSRTRTDDRFSAGGSDRVPEDYRRLIARYFESLAKKTP